MFTYGLPSVFTSVRVRTCVFVLLSSAVFVFVAVFYLFLVLFPVRTCWRATVFSFAHATLRSHKTFVHHGHLPFVFVCPVGDVWVRGGAALKPGEGGECVGRSGANFSHRPPHGAPLPLMPLKGRAGETTKKKASAGRVLA
ncbi:hypothetical protein TcCL_NonESM01520, partial [Trypanosoma cruzi]